MLVKGSQVTTMKWDSQCCHVVPVFPGVISIQRCCPSSIEIPIVKIRRSYLYNEYPYTWKDSLYISMGPMSLLQIYGCVWQVLIIFNTGLLCLWMVTVIYTWACSYHQTPATLTKLWWNSNISLKYICLYFPSYMPDREEILHIPRQHGCLVMCKI